MTSHATLATLSAVTAPDRRTAAEEIGASTLRAMLAAATAAGAHAFVSELAEGYDTPIGRGGVILSQSQRTRLAVARLLAADVPAVLVDDPTAGLDAAGEAAVMPGLETLFRGRTVMVKGASPAVKAAIARAARRSDAPRQAAALDGLPRDPVLPCIPRLLDPHAMAPLLGRSVGGDDVPDVRVQSVRYKPGDNVVVQYAVAASGGWVTAVAYSAAASDLEHKRTRRVNRRLARRVARATHLPEPLSYFPEVSALVQWLPLDVRLPLLSETGPKLARRLAKRELTDVGDGEPELLRYWPRRRAVLRLGPHILKIYRDAGDFEHARRGLRAATKLRRVRTPVYEGSSRTQQFTVQSLLPGHSPTLWPRSSEAAGSLLADLHADTALPLRATTPAAILAKSANRAEFVASLVPALEGEVESLLAELSASAPSGGPGVTSHGNFHAGQLLAGPDGLSLIDLDRLCLAAPAYDLASFAAHVAFGRPGETELVTATLESLLDGYGSRPAGLEWFLANCLLRRAPVSFRHQDEHWPDAAAALVMSARQALS